MGATIYDIAKKAGVSTCWVSFVLRDHPRAKEVSPEVRQRIKDTAAALHYHRNLSAVTISNGFNKSTIALIVPEAEIRNSINYMQSQYFGYIRFFNKHGYGVRIYCDDDMEKVFQEILSNQIRYVFICLYDQQKRDLCADFCRKNKLNAVFQGCYCKPYDDFPSFDSDDTAISASLVEYLAGLGHTRIAAVFGSLNQNANRDRYSGWLQGLKKCGLSDCSGMYLQNYGFSDAVFLDMLRKYQPSAIFASDLSIARRILNFCLFYHIPIPEAFSVVSLDCSQKTDFYLPFAITGTDHDNISENIVRSCLAHFEGRTSGSKFFPAEIIPGQSTAAPSGDLSWLDRLPENFESDRKWFPDNRIFEVEDDEGKHDAAGRTTKC